MGWSLTKVKFLCAEHLLCSSHCWESPTTHPLTPGYRERGELRKHGRIVQRHRLGAGTSAQAALRTDWLKSPSYEKPLSAHGYPASSNPLSTHWSQAFKVSTVGKHFTYWCVHIWVIFFAVSPTINSKKPKTDLCTQCSPWHLVDYIFVVLVKTE